VHTVAAVRKPPPCILFLILAAADESRGQDATETGEKDCGCAGRDYKWERGSRCGECWWGEWSYLNYEIEFCGRLGMALILCVHRHCIIIYNIKDGRLRAIVKALGYPA